MKTNILSSIILLISAVLIYTGYKVGMHETAMLILSLSCFFSGGFLVDAFVHKFILKPSHGS